MSKLVRGIFGAVAVTLTLGAAQLASGGDLSQIRFQPDRSHDHVINRAMKSDRSALAMQLQPGRTVAVNLLDQSILVRLYGAQVGEARRATPSMLRAPATGRGIVACEPVVSVLTEVARQLQPGRCVT